MTTSKSFRTVMQVLVLIAVFQIAASAQIVNARENRIVGLWDVQVTNANCDTGATLASFRGMHKYELGGTAQIIPATNPLGLSAHAGIWRHVRDNEYTLTFKMFRFDAAGNNIGWIIVKNTVSINDDATEYHGSGQAAFFDVNGNTIGRSCPVFSGTRFVSLE